MVHTTASVICQLEDSDYRGHSMAMLRRIADVLGHEVIVRFVKRNPDGTSPIPGPQRDRSRQGIQMATARPSKAGKVVAKKGGRT
jgi:hypothetical protein